jgi:DNA-binding CsgD family transcriptional regulator
MCERAKQRFAHGSLLAEKQGIQWMIADSAMELYQSKLMVLHAAYKIDKGLDFKSEVSMAKHFVANALGRIIDRAIQVHGALGYSTDSPLSGMATQARWARFADGADEIHQWRIAQRAIEAYKRKAQEIPLDPYDRLTNREREVLHLAAEGHTSAEIATRLSISPRTVEMHRSNLTRKLDLGTQADLIRFALRRGILPLEDDL